MSHDAVAKATGSRPSRWPAPPVPGQEDTGVDGGKFAREDAVLSLALDDLVAVRSTVLLGGSEAEVDAHDAHWLRLLSRRQRIRATLQRLAARDSGSPASAGGGA